MSAEASILISPASQSGLSSGDTFSVDVNVDSGADQLRAVQIKLNYDSTTFEVLSITEGTLFGNNVLVVPGSGDNGAGTITYELAATQDALIEDGAYTPKAGTLLTIEFNVKDSAEDGTYSLSFSEAKLRDENNEDLGGTATGSIVVVGTEEADSSTPSDTIDLGSSAKSTSSFSSSSSSSAEQVEYSYIFGSSPDDYKVLSRHGQVQTGGNWSQDVLILESQVEDELEGKYLFWEGKVMSLGTNSAGYLVVVFYEPLMVEGSEIEEIYEIIDGKAKEMGIEDAPVEFGEGTTPAISDNLQELMARVQEMENEGIENFTNNQSLLYDPAVLATVGKIPQIRTEKECWQWYFQDSLAISLNTSDEINNYLKGGVLLSTGLSPDGYFEISINQEADVDRESLMDEVYAIISREADNVGISEVPVVFKLVTPDEEDTLASTSDEEVAEEMEDVESQAQETPGFGFAAVLLSLSMAYYIKIRFEKGKS